jgi:hypothetical protein
LGAASAQADPDTGSVGDTAASKIQQACIDELSEDIRTLVSEDLALQRPTSRNMLEVVLRASSSFDDARLKADCLPDYKLDISGIEECLETLQRDHAFKYRAQAHKDTLQEIKSFGTCGGVTPKASTGLPTPG